MLTTGNRRSIRHQLQNALLRKRLEDSEKTPEDRKVVQLKVVPEIKQEPKVGFEHHESWWQWIKKVIFRN